MIRHISKKRFTRIALGLIIGTTLGWSLAGVYSGGGLIENTAHARETATDPSWFQQQLLPNPLAKQIAGHLLAAIAAIFFCGIVVGILAGDTVKEPMEQAALQDAAGDDSHE